MKRKQAKVLISGVLSAVLALSCPAAAWAEDEPAAASEEDGQTGDPMEYVPDEAEADSAADDPYNPVDENFPSEDEADSAADDPYNPVEETGVQQTPQQGVQATPGQNTQAAAPAAEEEDGKASISAQKFPMYLADLSNEAEITLYFVNGVTDLPYVDLTEWANVMVSVYRDWIEDSDYSLQMEHDGHVYQYTRENNYHCIFDFEEGTILFDDFDGFGGHSGDRSLLDMVSVEYSDEDGNPLLFNRVARGSFDRYGHEIEIDLSDYDIPIYWSENDDLYMVPLQTMGDLFVAVNGHLNTFFNGDAVYLASYGLFGAASETHTPFGDSYYDGKAGEMSEELAWYNYCELCLALDHLYGLKEIHDIQNFDRFFTETGFRKDLTSTDSNVVDGALYDFIGLYLDDLHSGFNAMSFRTEEVQTNDQKGMSMLGTVDVYNRLNSARGAADHVIESYEEFGNTAYITFDNFDMRGTSAADYYEGKIERDIDPAADPTDNLALIIYAHEQITRPNSPIKNVVIDLSLNGGGALDACAFVASWFLGEAAISIRSSLTGAVSTGIYSADVNLDGKFDENDTVKDKNLYCIISPYSFSCGNLLPNIFKHSNKVTLLGKTSGGGSCSVLQMSTASGTMFQMSSPLRMSYLKNGSYYDTDTGIEPEVQITKPENFYDRVALTSHINNLF